MKALLIEPDPATRQSILLMLKAEGLTCDETDLGEEGIDLGKFYDYDIILLEIGLPDISGFDVIRVLRTAKIKTPILVLSGLAGIEDKVRGFGHGADDYLTKPFYKDELFARIHAIVRRSKGHAESIIVTGDLIVNIDQKTVEVNGVQIKLTAKQFAVMETLALRAGQLVTIPTLLNSLYGGMDEPELKIIQVFISKIRKLLSDAADGRKYIETVWGLGYRLTAPAFWPPVGEKADAA